MLVSIGSYDFCNGTLAGGVAVSELRVKLDRVLDTAVPLSGELNHGLLTIGRTYRILLFEAGDDFTNLGAINVTGAVFVAADTTPADWSHGSILIQDPAPVIFDRACRKGDVAFLVKRVHANLADAEAFILQLDNNVPDSGEIIFTTTGPSPATRTIPNGVLLDHSLVQHLGSTTFHQYHVAGGAPAA